MSSTIVSLEVSLRHRAQRAIRRNGWLFADQALVSGFNFLTSALLARMLGIHGYGVFSIFYLALLYLNSIQAAALISPMLSLAPQMRDAGERAQFLRGMSSLQYAFSACSALLFGTAVVLIHKTPWFHLGYGVSIALPYALTIVWFQLQDWLRRLFYVDDRGRSVFWNDAVSYVGQVLCFGLLWRYAHLNLDFAYYAMAITSCIAFVLGCAAAQTRPSIRDLRHAAPIAWSLGKSLLVASQFQWLSSYGLMLVVAVVVGVKATAGVRAIIAIIAPLNVLYLLLDNVIPVRAARIFNSQGKPAMVRYLRRICSILSVGTGIAIVGLVAFSRPLMILSFGKPFAMFAPLVFWQGINMWLVLPYRTLQYYHRTVGTAKAIVRTAFAVSIISVVSAALLARRYGAEGVMITFAGAQLVGLVSLLIQTSGRDSDINPLGLQPVGDLSR